jgi:hypothetical protein
LSEPLTEPLWIICARQSDPMRLHCKGAQRFPCAGCGEIIVVQPDTLVAVGAQPRHYVCLQCMDEQRPASFC